MKHYAAIRSPQRFRNIVIVLALGTCFVSALPAAAEAANCATSAESRQMDFWLGDWAVSYPNAPSASTSKVYLDLDKCLLIESWVGGKNHRGMNMFAYSADDKSWHGMFADNEGRVHVFEGTASAGSAEFRGLSRGPGGKEFLNRIRLIRVNAGQVEQSWEKSSDNGDTWTMEFQGEYSLKKP